MGITHHHFTFLKIYHAPSIESAKQSFKADRIDAENISQEGLCSLCLYMDSVQGNTDHSLPLKKTQVPSGCVQHLQS
jgi:hypothetical protein